MNTALVFAQLAFLSPDMVRSEMKGKGGRKPQCLPPQGWSEFAADADAEHAADLIIKIGLGRQRGGAGGDRRKGRLVIKNVLNIEEQRLLPAESLELRRDFT
ncbi:hypothetical protein KXV85_003591, partial [Aspergillus fumigatus]